MDGRGWTVIGMATIFTHIENLNATLGHLRWRMRRLTITTIILWATWREVAHCKIFFFFFQDTVLGQDFPTSSNTRNPSQNSFCRLGEVHPFEHVDGKSDEMSGTSAQVSGTIACNRFFWLLAVSWSSTIAWIKVWCYYYRESIYPRSA